MLGLSMNLECMTIAANSLGCRFGAVLEENIFEDALARTLANRA